MALTKEKLRKLLSNKENSRTIEKLLKKYLGKVKIDALPYNILFHETGSLFNVAVTSPKVGSMCIWFSCKRRKDELELKYRGPGLAIPFY